MKSKGILLLAVVMGVVTTILFYQYMKRFDQEALQKQKMVEVAVAKKRIDKNQIISKEMIEMKQMPKEGVHPQTIQNLSEVEGKFATELIEVGEPLLGHMLQNQKEESLFVSRKIREGYRAVSVEVNFIESVSNLIEPEHFVDIVFSEQRKMENKQTPVKTELLLEKVRVLAVGKRMIEVPPKEGASKASSDAASYVEYTSITVEVKPEDALKLINASERGNIQFILQSNMVPSEEKIPLKKSSSEKKGSEVASKQKQPTRYVMVITPMANIRVKPNLKAKVNSAVKYTSCLKYLNEEQKDKDGIVWLKVETNEGKSGWISSYVVKWYQKGAM